MPYTSTCHERNQDEGGTERKGWICRVTKIKSQAEAEKLCDFPSEEARVRLTQASTHPDTVPRPGAASLDLSCSVLHEEVEVSFHFQVENRTVGPGMVCTPVINPNTGRRQKDAKFMSYKEGSCLKTKSNHKLC